MAQRVVILGQFPLCISLRSLRRHRLRWTGPGRCAPPHRDEIITIHQLKNLTPEQSALGHPVHLTGVRCFLLYDSGWNQLYVCDGHETGYFNSHDFLTQPQTGQLVEIFATTAAGNSLTNAKLTVPSPGTVPDAKKLELPQLGGDWSEWIETTGQVLSAENNSGRLALLLQANSQNCLVYVLGAVPGGGAI